MYFLYNIFLFAYFFLTSPYYAIHVLMREHYRAGLFQRFGFIKVRWGDEEDLPRVWFHGVSVGEIQVLVELGEKLRKLVGIHPLYSTTTLAAQRLAARRLGPEANLIYFPLDFPFAVARTLDKVKPALVVLAETELWPNFFKACHARRIPVVLVNGRISDRSFTGYQLIRRFTRVFLPWVEQFLMQNKIFAQRIVQLGAPCERVRVTGNMKADNPVLPGAVPRELENLCARLRSSKGTQILLAGSTHPGEEILLAKLYGQWKSRFPRLILVLAPRHLERVGSVMQGLNALGLKSLRRSQLAGFENEVDFSGVDILVLDTLGELAWAYAWADLVFVGKSLCARGGQNPMEAARLARPLLFGPHMENFQREAQELLRAGAAVEVSNEGELKGVVADLLSDPKKIYEMGQKARIALENLRGATDENFQFLRDKIIDLRSKSYRIQESE